MRIFYAAYNTPNPAIQSDLWRNNLYLPLVDLGHDVVEFEYDLSEVYANLDPAFSDQRRFIEKNRPLVSAALLQQLRRAHAQKPVDLFFSYFYDACVLPETLDAIRAMGIRTVNWYCNGSYQMNLVAEISPHYDFCLVPEKFRLDDYRRLGAHPLYTQEAANPNIYKPYDVPVEFDVTFVGQAYGDRPDYIRYLLDAGIDVRVWGVGWQQYGAGLAKFADAGMWQRYGYLARKLLTAEGQRRALKKLRSRFGMHDGGARGLVRLPPQVIGGVLGDEDLVRMYSRSKINLGFSSCGNTHETRERILQIRLRDFEVPMSGGFYMVEYMEELEEFFDIGREVVCYRDREELADKIKYYLAHDAEREQIRAAGYRRCLRDHTWHKRFQTAFREMGLE
jgi:spore maturation protein CgeB